MSELKKIILTPFFGELPSWFDKFKQNFDETLGKQGYSWLMTQDLDDFNSRCERELGFKSPIVWGNPKLWDYRCCLGLLYDDLIKDFDYWATMDFDMVFGNVSKWFHDEEIAKYHLWSNHHSYVNGCFSLYYNSEKVNNLFKDFPKWKEVLLNPVATGWVENEYSRIIEHSLISYKYSFHQGWPYTITPNLRYENGHLYQDGEEICMFHFRRSKKYPI